MIREYLRPNSIEETLSLLSETGKERRPMGGGTSLSRQQTGLVGVVDLQNVGLDQISIQSQEIRIGAMVRLESLLMHPEVHPEIKRAIHIDASENIRNMASLGGWLISSDGRSILTTALLALDTNLTWEPESFKVHMGDWLPMRANTSPGVLMTEALWWTGSYLVFEYVARSPKDRPILVVAMAQWGSGRTRVALGGFGNAPMIAMDGPDSSGVDVASKDACAEAEDQWASAEYRQDVAANLAQRCLRRIETLISSEA